MRTPSMKASLLVSLLAAMSGAACTDAPTAPVSERSQLERRPGEGPTATVIDMRPEIEDLIARHVAGLEDEALSRSLTDDLRRISAAGIAGDRGAALAGVAALRSGLDGAVDELTRASIEAVLDLIVREASAQ